VVPKHSNPAALPYEGPGWFRDQETVAAGDPENILEAISFSTLPNHFQRDADQCQSQCAAPAELYYHQNPGGAVEQMVSASSQQPYTSLKSAWRYRKEFVQGCSCKAAEYQPPAGGDKKAEVPAAPGGPSATARLNTK